MTSALQKVVFVTGNAGKLREVNAILAGHVDVTSEKVDLPELQGEAEEIAKEKCRTACQRLGTACLTEDTSLCFNALNGLPGPYIKWFLDGVKCEGLKKMLAGYEDQTAYAQCIFCYCRPGGEPITFVGRCHGRIVDPAGPRNFGWDPVFCPDAQEDALTFAEMSPEAKNKISHRALALEKVKVFFTTAPDAATPEAKKAKVTA